MPLASKATAHYNDGMTNAPIEPVMRRCCVAIGLIAACCVIVSVTAVPTAHAKATDDAIGKAIELRKSGQFDTALKLLQAVIVNDPSNARAFLELGVLHAIHGDLGRASEAFRQALRLDPKMVAARRNLAETLRADGKHDEALPMYRDLARMPKYRVLALRGTAICAEGAGRKEDARAALNTLKREQAGTAVASWADIRLRVLSDTGADAGISAEAAEKEGNAHFVAGRHAHARAWYQHACDVGPTADRCFRLAITQMGAHDFLAAVASLRKSLAIDPGHMPSLSAWPTAMRWLRTRGDGALNVDLPTATDERPITRAAKAIIDGDNLLATRICDAALKGPDKGVVLTLIRAESWLRRGSLSRADTDLKAILAKTPDHVAARQMRAEVMFLSRRFATARYLAGLQKPATAPPGSPDAVRAAYGSPTRDLEAFVRWRRANIIERLQGLVDPGTRAPAPFSWTDRVDPESIRVALAEPAKAAKKPRKRKRKRRRRRRRR